MSIKKVERRIEVECKYDSALHKWVRKHGYKWDAAKKIWWKGYTVKEMEAVEKEFSRINGVVDAIRDRVAKAMVIHASYDDTVRVKDELRDIGGVFYADKAWRADNQAAYDAAISVIKAAKPQPKAVEKVTLAEGEVEVSVSKDRRTNFVGGVITVGKEKVPHICVREIEAYRFTDGLSMGMGRDDGWCHKLAVRPMTSGELADRDKRLKLAELEKALRYYTGPLDDDRNAEAFAAKAKEIREQLEKITNG